jgi:hypothetical protein
MSAAEALHLRVTLGPVAAIPEGEGRTFVVDGRRLAVFRGRDGASSASATTANSWSICKST